MWQERIFLESAGGEGEPWKDSGEHGERGKRRTGGPTHEQGSYSYRPRVVVTFEECDVRIRLGPMPAMPSVVQREAVMSRIVTFALRDSDSCPLLLLLNVSLPVPVATYPCRSRSRPGL